MLIAIRRDIPSISNQSIEQIFVQFTLKHTNFILGGVYLPPHSPIDSYTIHLPTVDELILNYSSHFFIICGDFNLPHITWSNDTNGLCYYSSTSSHSICVPESYSLNGFF